MAESSPNPSRSFQLLEATLLLLGALFFALHFTHLTADFPNHSPWMDWSKYTDEGWYGDAAIRYFTRGQWYVSGDFNPAAALPVWPLLEAALFRFTGVSLVAARALTVSVFGAILVSAYLLLRRWQRFDPDSTMQLRLPFAHPYPRPSHRDTLAPAIAVLLLAVSPFCFVFTRIAILEPLLILLTLLALHAVTSARSARLGTILSLGLLFPAMILTKTTAIFLLPAIFFLLYASTSYHMRQFLRTAVPASVLAVILWCTYFFLLVRPHFLIDYRYLFSANAYTGITATTALTVLRNTAVDFLWAGKLLCALFLAAALITLARPLHLFRRQPLTVALLLWVLGYAAFLAYHNNLQPRYYLVPAIPLVLLTSLLCAPALDRFRSARFNPARPLGSAAILSAAVATALAAIVFVDARQTLTYVLHPEYTLIQAADSIAEVIKDDPAQNSLILSISGSDISLITGLPSICDDFGTLELADRVKRYRPGWYAAWNQIDDDKMDALTPLYHPVRVAAFPAMDDPARNLLILYRLDPKTPTPKLRPRRQPIPRSLQTKLGQQPSVNQLEH